MERVKVKVPYAEQIEIVPIGDVHLGSTNCRFDKFKKQIEYIRKTPNCYAIFMGDLFDSILGDDKRYDASEQTEAFLDILNEMTDVLLPIKDKILVMLLGNHEYHLKKKGVGDPIYHLSNRLGCKYGGFSCFLKITPDPSPKKGSLVIYAHNGWFAGRKRGAKVNNIEGLAQNYVDDVYLCGHSHDIFSTRSVSVSWERTRKLLFVNTGSFVETATEGTCNYSGRAGYPPQKLGVCKIKWYPTQQKVYATE